MSHRDGLVPMGHELSLGHEGLVPMDCNLRRIALPPHCNCVSLSHCIIQACHIVSQCVTLCHIRQSTIYVHKLSNRHRQFAKSSRQPFASSRRLSNRHIRPPDLLSTCSHRNGEYCFRHTGRETGSHVLTRRCRHSAFPELAIVFCA